jgi:hypothetical protein
MLAIDIKEETVTLLFKARPNYEAMNKWRRLRPSAASAASILN